MASIIRSPTMSAEKRKLSTRRTSAAPNEVAPAPIMPPAPISPLPTAQEAATDTVPADNADVQALVEQARQSVLLQFKEEAEKARELGRERGLREGRLTGADEAKQSFADELARMRSLSDQLEKALSDGILGLEDVAVAIAFEAISKVLGDAALTREGVLAMVRQATRHATGAERLVVRLHAADLALLRQVSGLDEELDLGTSISWAADPTVALGGCVVETDGGALDARLETQLDRLCAALRATRNGSPHGAPSTAHANRRRRASDRQG